MPSKKVNRTPDFVRGLLRAADNLPSLLNPKHESPRVRLEQLKHLVEQNEITDVEWRELGIYQGRVVLVVLAAELALKYLWEQLPRNHGKSAGNGHNLHELFEKLPKCVRAEIENRFKEWEHSMNQGWETADKVFETCKNASVQWRYLVEEGNYPNYTMRATTLQCLTRIVLDVVSTPPDELVPGEF